MTFLDDLIAQWIDARDAGRPISPYSLCRSTPHLLEPLLEKIKSLGWDDQQPDTAPHGETPNPQHGESGGALLLPRLAEYEILATLGRGGMGVVYRAWDKRRHHEVALKTLPSLSPSALYRFKQEFRSLAGIVHPNLVTLYDLVQNAETCFFTMELLEGSSFDTFLRDGEAAEQLVPARINRLRHAFEQLALGLEALHSADKVHRDVKPTNVLVCKDGRVVILDFGLAADVHLGGIHQTIDGHVVGTFAYMSPEQAAGAPVSASTDWYSVGVMLYQALTGSLPFKGQAREILIQKQLQDPQAPSACAAGIPADLDQLCLSLLSRSPHKRPSGEEIIRRLQGITQDHPAAVPRRRLFVGRETERRELLEAFGRARSSGPITVSVEGASGLGKSALVNAFLEEVSDAGAVLLTGRCYEREAVPFKAVDPLIDALSEFLLRLPQAEMQSLVPRWCSALVRVFPVLQRVPVIRDHTQSAVPPDPQEVRRQAFNALKDLLGKLADSRPLVLVIDDIHWGDSDSAALIEHILQRPDAPLCLLVVCSRNDHCFATTIDAFQAIRSSAQQITLSPLSPTEAAGLASKLLADGEKGLAERIGAEAGGSPFYIQELARYAQHLESEQSVLRLEDVLYSRIEKLPPSARQLLEAVAVAGRPVELSLGIRAAGIAAENVTELLALLQDRLVRSAPGESESVLVAYHDRVRETVVARLSIEQKLKYHRQLAELMVADDEYDAEEIAEHWEEAKEDTRAAEYFELAAARAAAGLAFDHASSLYAKALRLSSRSESEARPIRIALADALSNAGRGRQAAEEYLRAAGGSSGPESDELRRRAAEQYLVSGHFDEGNDELRDLLRSVGIRVPSSMFGKIVRIVVSRAKLRLASRKLAPNLTGLKRARDAFRSDLCWSAFTGVSMIDPLQAAVLQLKGLLYALKIGDDMRAARHFAAAAMLTSIGGQKTSQSVERLLRQAQSRCSRIDDRRAEGLVLAAQGMAAYLRGEWTNALKGFREAETFLRANCQGVFWELDTANIFATWSLSYLGRLQELVERRAWLLNDAAARGDLFLSATLGSGVFAYCQLAADRPQSAVEYCQAAMSRWTAKGFHVQHHSLTIANTIIDLYQGNGLQAWTRIRDSWPLYRRSMLLNVELIYIDILQHYGRSAVAAASVAQPQRMCAIARRAARKLQRKKTPWAQPLAKAILAGVAARSQQLAQACKLLQEAACQFEDVDMGLFRAAADYHLGRFQSTKDQQAVLHRAVEWMRKEGIRCPDRMANMLIPGFEGDDAS